MQLIANMMTKLTQKEMDANFHDWMTDLVHDMEIDPEIRKAVVADFCQTRHVLIIEILNFFPEMIGDPRYDEDYPFAVVSKARPTMITMELESYEQALEFCKDHGMTHEVNLVAYNKRRH